MNLVHNVSIDDLNRVGKKYLLGLFDPQRVKTAIVCVPSKVDEVQNALKK